jgi:MFS family permease
MHANSAGRAEDPYARYALGVLVVVYVFNFLDRQIVSILAERIKADLRISDAQIGYLYGTAFAVFYALFGIPLGRLADVWDRRLLISIGLAFWSAMTAASGFARSFTQLALARCGVGIGEASASPAAYSMLSDLFPPSRRATALALYSSGIYIGSGLGLGLGGLVVDRWDAAVAAGVIPAVLKGWQAAFLVVGLPGLVLSLWVRSLREPVRGQMDGIATATPPPPFAAFLRELCAVIPPFTLWQLWWYGAGVRAVITNLAAAGGVVGGAVLLTRALGTPAQWISLGLGIYAAVSWAQNLAVRDRPTFALVFRTPALALGVLGFACLAFTSYGVGFWMAPLFMRVHGVDAARVGLFIGGSAAVGGWLGVTMGGVLADRWRLRSPSGRLQVGMLAGACSLPLVLALLWTDSVAVAFLLSIPTTGFAAMWVGPAASTVQDLVLPRMRAVASAAFLLVNTLIGLALGPYTIGRLSVATGDLRAGMALGSLASVLGIVLLALAARTFARDEATKLERARLAGEPLVA